MFVFFLLFFSFFLKTKKENVWYVLVNIQLSIEFRMGKTEDMKEEDSLL